MAESASPKLKPSSISLPVEHGEPYGGHVHNKRGFPPKDRLTIVKIFGKKAVTSGATLALAFTLFGPTAPANAGDAIFHVHSAVTGKCLQWNGVGKTITLEKCANKMSQFWGQAGGQIASYADTHGDYCVSITKKLEKPPVGAYCWDAPGTRMNDHLFGHKTYFAAAAPGFPSCNFKTVNKKAVCGKRTSTLKPMQWLIGP
ncbi:hypothetical protein AB0N17_24660 [Streptomyces sp. NPDC051133]|uniref:hypothetical protein n=1 Tax=Streptomyces sp. NPDC051133 TaxID=3155521 RepID=UPI00341D9A08